LVETRHFSLPQSV